MTQISENPADNYDQIMADCDAAIAQIDALIERNATYLQYQIKDSEGNDGHDLAIQAREQLGRIRRTARHELNKLDPERAGIANERSGK